jgi:hypothetical protein
MSFKKLTISIFTFIIGLYIIACTSKPRVIEGEPMDVGPPVGRVESPVDPIGRPDQMTDEHRVVVEEALNTDRYTYLNVSENGEKFWIAIPRKEIQIGGTYFYKGGLLKRNFESKEFNRVFDTIYLVSDVIPYTEDTGITAKQGEADQSVHSEEPIRVEPAEGVIKLSALFSNPAEYQGKLVKVTGKCVKVNPMIMGRNWVHLQDGSGDDLDLTITTTDQVPLGAVVSLEGIIALDKDFGAGYRYDVIMENASLK